MSDRKKFVIVGAGHGGVQLAASLRENGYQGTITLLSEEADLPYHRPPLSKGFLADGNARTMPLKGQDFYAQNEIELSLKSQVTSIDLHKKTLLLEDGGALEFDRLALATGSIPRVIPIPGYDGENVFTLRSSHDAAKLREFSTGERNIAIIGGGFIGLEVAATLKKLGNQVHLFEISQQLMGRSVCPHIAAHVLDHYSSIGINMNMGCGVDEIIQEDKSVVGVLCASKSIAVDAVVMAVGAMPDVSLAREAGIALDENSGGIIVNGQMQTSADDIYALGDAVSYHHPLVDKKIRLESVQNAVDQAKHLSQSVMGQVMDYQALPWFWSDQDSLKLQMAGLPAPDASQIIRRYENENKLSVFLLEKGLLTGVQTINAPADHLMGRKLIERRFSPDIEFLRDPKSPLKELL